MCLSRLADGNFLQAAERCIWERDMPESDAGRGERPDSKAIAAIDLMRNARTLLDASTSPTQVATAYLQLAIDLTAHGELAGFSAAPAGNPADAGGVDVNAALVRATGGALTMFAALMASKNLTTLDEAAKLLGIYATSTSREDQLEGMILGRWAATMMEVAKGPKPGTVN